MTYYHIKYGNRLYLAVEDIHNVLWTNDMNKAITFLNLDDASEVLDQIKKDTGLYEASIVMNNDLLTSDDFKELCIQEWSKHKTISVIARIASRYYSTPIKATAIRKVLTSCGIVLPPIKRVASIYDTQLGR